MVVSFVAFAGCKEGDPGYCLNAAHVGRNGCPDAATSGGSCKGDNECTDKANFPACDTSPAGGGVCSKCTASSHGLCTDQTPHCDNHDCVACLDDNDCESGAGVCMPSGGCAASISVLHAKVNGTGATCSAASPCSLDVALVTAKVGPKIIKLDDAGTYQSVTNYASDVDASMALTIDARNATIHRNGASPIFTINDDKGLTILGGTIEGPTGGTTEAVRCGNRATFAAYGTTIKMSDGPGINAPGGCTLTLSRSRIALNQGGGAVITNGKFVIVGNVFLNNGSSTSIYGGITISVAPDPMNRLDFNTIAYNTVDTGIVTGVDCNAGTGIVGRYNIIWKNNNGVDPQVGNSCKHAWSDIGPNGVPAANDGGNDLNVDPLLDANLHLQVGSPVHGKADPSADLTGLASRDIDGDLRVAPADLGADQIPRP